MPESGSSSEELIPWLLAHGGPMIRFRTLTELCPSACPGEIREAAWQVERCDEVQSRMRYFRLAFKHTLIRGSSELGVCNLLLTLRWLGCRAGMRSLDAQVEPFLELMRVPASMLRFGHPLDLPALGNCLAYAGYTREPAVRAWQKRRLNALYEFVSRGTYDPYVEPPRSPRRPINHEQTPVIDPQLYADGELTIPMMFDLYGLAAYPPELIDGPTFEKIQAIVAYVMDPRYQHLRRWLGLVVTGSRRFNLAGEAAHLAGFTGEETTVRASRRLRHMAMVSSFPGAVGSRWYRDGLAELRAFRTPEGRYLFPLAYLPEERSGRFVEGTSMAVHPRPRNEAARERESTFYMALLTQQPLLRVRAVRPPVLPRETDWLVGPMYSDDQSVSG